jgi:hypothetical protein
VAKHLQEWRSKGSQGLLHHQAHSRNQELKRAGISSHTRWADKFYTKLFANILPTQATRFSRASEHIPANPKHAHTARQQNQRIKKTVRRNNSSSDANTPVSPPCAKSLTNSSFRAYNHRETHVDPQPTPSPSGALSLKRLTQRPLYIQLAYTLIPPICGTRPGTCPSYSMRSRRHGSTARKATLSPSSKRDSRTLRPYQYWAQNSEDSSQLTPLPMASFPKLARYMTAAPQIFTRC